jgi:hypothetical protein
MKFTNKMFSKQWHRVFVLSLCLAFYSPALFAYDQDIGLSASGVQQEITPEAVNEDGGILNTYIIVPIKWVDNVVTEVFSIIIPIKGVAAEYNAADTLKYVEDMIKGSNENLKKYPEVVADALEMAKKGLAFQNELIAAQLASPSFQETLRKSQEIMDGINQQFKQKVAQDEITALLYQNSEKTKEFYGKNPARLKSMFERIINSDLADRIKERAREMLVVLNSGVSQIDSHEITDLFLSVMSSGAYTYIICETGCGVIGGVAAGLPTGGVGTQPGFVAGVIECGPLCTAISNYYAAINGIKTGSDNMHFRKGSVSNGYTEKVNKPSANQIKKYQLQLEKDGAGSLRKSKDSLDEQLKIHRQKLDTVKKEGGYTSSIEREIRNFEAEIEAIEQILKNLR